MDSLVVQIVTWWMIGVIGFALEWTNHRCMAGFCVLVILCGFTVTVANEAVGNHIGDPPFVAAKAGNEYHRKGAVCVRNVHDPIPFYTEDEAQDEGFSPCERCILHLYEVSMKDNER